MATTDTTPKTGLPAADSQAFGWRLAWVTAFVGLWMALGYGLELSANVYLLVGIPLTVLFQRYVARQPLRDLWVGRNGPIARRGRGEVAGMFVAIVPVVSLFGALVQGRMPSILYWLAGCLGIAGAVYTVSAMDRETWRDIRRCLTSAGVFGTVAMVILAWINPSAQLHSMIVSDKAFVLVSSFFQYIAICHILEEVSFRGAFYAYLDGDSSGRGTPAAVLTSLLWGLWHLPLLPQTAPLWQSILFLIALHLPTGYLMAIHYRRSRNLIVPVVTHAWIDAVRNAIALAH